MRHLHRRAALGLGANMVLAPAAFSQAASGVPPAAALLSAKAAETRTKLVYDGQRFSGPAYDVLLREGRRAQFFQIGEEHGIAENPKLTAQLFEDLAPAGYRHLGIEVSPPMAGELDLAARQGLSKLRRLNSTPGDSVAFFGMHEEAEMLVRVRAAVKGSRPAFWGLDYEVGADRRLIGLIEAAPKPAQAGARLAELKAACAASWARYEATRDPQMIFSFAGDPALVRAVRDAWPKPDPASQWVLETLEETFEINRLWSSRQGWASNLRRSRFIRANFLRYWRAERAVGRAPRVMLKMGANHQVRGLNSVGMFDLGSLLPEVAAAEGGEAFGLMILPGVTSNVAVLDPSTWRYRNGSAKDRYADGLELLGAQAWPNAFTLFDLRALRPFSMRAGMAGAYPELVRVINGFDNLLLMSGSTPSRNL